MKYIDTEKLIADIERLTNQKKNQLKRFSNEDYTCSVAASISCELYGNEEVLSIIKSLQQEQPIEGKQVIIITETDGDANIHWDCRSLDDVKALLASAQSFIADKQVEELRGQGSGPDYNTTEGRFRNIHKFQQEQPEVDLESKLTGFMGRYAHENGGEYPSAIDIAEHFYKLGLDARK